MTGAIGQCMHFEGHTFVLGPWVGRWRSNVFSLVPDSLSNPPKNHGLPSYQGWLFYFFYSPLISRFWVPRISSFSFFFTNRSRKINGLRTSIRCFSKVCIMPPHFDQTPTSVLVCQPREIQRALSLLQKRTRP